MSVNALPRALCRASELSANHESRITNRVSTAPRKDAPARSPLAQRVNLNRAHHLLPCNDANNLALALTLGAGSRVAYSSICPIVRSVDVSLYRYERLKRFIRQLGVPSVVVALAIHACLLRDSTSQVLESPRVKALIAHRALPHSRFRAAPCFFEQESARHNVRHVLLAAAATPSCTRYPTRPSSASNTPPTTACFRIFVLAIQHASFPP